MNKITALFFMALFLLCMITHSARLEPAFQEESLESTKLEDIDESCEGIKEDECLMRRTLAAHIDYIYTQKQNP
uniref:Phytosulfokine n=1 Tax=Cajanus cajan TaxID=3821 RepID=A0A151SC84_CAJCA|nr:Phytosulfokines 3 [Cajanus cajan]